MTVEVSALKTLHLFFILSTRYFTNSQCYHACYTHDMRQLLTELWSEHRGGRKRKRHCASLAKNQTVHRSTTAHWP